MGEVYRARDTRLGREVALKVLPPDRLFDAERRRRFLQEARAASALNHPNVVTFYDLADANGQTFLVMEYVAGKTLDQVIPPKGLPLKSAAAYAIQIVDGLAAAHAAGIVHRDLKPANIIVGEKGTVKLLDFGLAKLREPVDQNPDAVRTHTGLVLGTFAYMSPEQAEGHSVDARSDIFSFGCVLYEMLTGQRLFRGSSPALIVSAILRDEPPEPCALRADIPNELQQILRRCLRKDPAMRFQHADALKIALLEAQEEIEGGLGPERPRILHSRRRKRLIAAAAAAVAVIAGGLFWILWEKDYFWRNPLANARIERVTDFDGDELDAAISSDGKLMSFVSDRDGRFDVWVSPVGSGEFLNVTKGGFRDLEPDPIRKLAFAGNSGDIWFLQGFGAGPYQGWLASLTGPPHPFIAGAMELAWSADGRRIAWHTAPVGDPMFVADANGSNPRQIYVEEAGHHCHHLTWSPDGQFIYFVKGNPTSDEMDIWRIRVSDHSRSPRLERITSHNARVGYPACLDARTLIYSAPAEDGSGESLYTIDVERRIPHRVSSGILERYLSVGASATIPRRLICTVANPTVNLWTVPVSDRNQNESEVSRFPVQNARALAPRMASGYSLFLSSRGGGDAIWKREDAGATRELWRGVDGSVIAPPAVSPDGSRICFSFWKNGRAGLYLMDANGTNIRPLAPALEVRSAVSWSPDGKTVAAAATLDQGTRLFLIPVDGGAPVRLLDTASYNPVWSPDGNLIVYSEPMSGSNMAVRAVTRNGAPVPMPRMMVPYIRATPYRFLPGGKILIFLKNASSHTRDFYWINLETGEERQLTNLKPGTLIQSFDVSLDGQQIIFDRQKENADVVLIDLPR
jgi:Tol biopolymer transport system component